jgi:hypothetical protein
MTNHQFYTCFAGTRRIATGPVQAVVAAAKTYLDDGGGETLLIFDDRTGRQVDFDFHGTPAQVLERLEDDPSFASPARKVGRPRLGVTSREVSLLPRHWAWLETQPGGASGSLRKLVERAMKSGKEREEARRARDAAGQFMWNMAGDLPGFEEATRALYRKDTATLRELIAAWPADIRAHTLSLVKLADEAEAAAQAVESARRMAQGDDSA